VDVQVRAQNGLKRPEQELRAKMQIKDENQARIDAKIQAKEAAKLAAAERRAAENAQKEKAAEEADAAKHADGDDDDDEDEDDLFGDNEEDDNNDNNDNDRTADHIQEQVAQTVEQPPVRVFIRCMMRISLITLHGRSMYGQPNRMTTMTMTTTTRMRMQRVKATTTEISACRLLRLKSLRTTTCHNQAMRRNRQMALSVLSQLNLLSLCGDSTWMMMTMRKISFEHQTKCVIKIFYSCIMFITR
jgi:hypothetical protein